MNELINEYYEKGNEVFYITGVTAIRDKTHYVIETTSDRTFWFDYKKGWLIEDKGHKKVVVADKEIAAYLQKRLKEYLEELTYEQHRAKVILQDISSKL